MTRRRRAAATAMGMWALAAGLSAQTLPVPALPPPVTGDDFAGAEAARPRPWEYAVGAGVGWDGNIDFLVPDGPRGLAVLPRLGVARVFASPRGQLRATAAAGFSGYPDQRELDRHQGELGLAGSYRPSPGTTWRGSASYAVGHTGASPILVAQGVSLPVADMRTLAGQLGLRTGGERTALRVDARWYRTDFDSELLIDGDSLRGTVALERRASSRNTFSVELAVEDVLSDAQGRAYLTHYGSLQWSRVLSPRSALLLEAGGSYTPEAGRAGLERQRNFFGGASFSRQLDDSTVTLFVRREVTPAFGLGVSRLDFRAGLSAAVPIGRTAELRIAASHAQPDAPPQGTLMYGASTEAFASVGRRLGRHVEVSCEARYRRRGRAGALPEVEAFGAGVFLTLTSPGGRALVRASGT